MDDKAKRFLDEYLRLCEKYQLCVGSCTCCDSPFISTVEPDTKEYSRFSIVAMREHLKEMAEEEGIE